MPSASSASSDPSAPFGNLMRRARQAAGLTQAELAERAGLSWRGVNDLERGVRRRPRRDTVALLAAALGLSDEERAAFEVAAHPPAGSSPDLPTGAPPLNPVEPRLHNLPIPPTPLLGREREAREVTALLRRADVRLVTLTGPGGVGKTRLALQVAAELVDDFADGVWFVSLSRLSDPALVLLTIARTLGLRELGSRSIQEQLRAHLQTRRLLLVLDNCEQVVAAAPEVAELLESSPGLKVLVTSRVALHLQREKEYPLLPLALPPVAGSVSPRRSPRTRLTEYAAVTLFVERAQDAQPDFQVTEATAPDIAAICARLDGLPLALELAAVRVKLLPPAALLRRLERTLPLLTGGARDLEARQRTMRATLAWSEDLLQPEERRLFRRLAVFVGGFTLEAAEAVCAAPAEAASLGVDVWAGLAALVDHSLVQRWSVGQDGADGEEGGGEARFRFLHVVREYALEWLEASGEAQALRRAHAVYYLGQVEERAFAVWGAKPGPWQAWLAREHDNFRAALAWARDRGEVELGLRLAASLGPFWYVRGHITEGRGWVEGLLALLPHAVGTGDDGGAGAPGGLAVSAVAQAKALVGMSIFALARGDDERALAAAEAGLALARGQQAGWATGLALATLGEAMWGRGDLERATACLEESVAQLRAVGEPEIAATYRALVGAIALERGNLERATACCEESLAFARRTGADHPEGIALACLMHIARQRGNLAGAASLGREQLLVWRRLGDAAGLAGSLEDLALVVAAVPSGEAWAERAARLLGAAAELRERVGIVRKHWWGADIEREAAPARAALGEAGWAAAFAAGRALSLEEAVTEALGGDESAGALKEEGMARFQQLADLSQ